MTREIKGIIGFISLTLIAITALGLIFGFTPLTIGIGAVITLAFMVGREVWQYKTKQIDKFEYEDVVEYGIFIATTAVLYTIIVAVFKEL